MSDALRLWEREGRRLLYVGMDEGRVRLQDDINQCRKEFIRPNVYLVHICYQGLYLCAYVIFFSK